jgi:glycyl-tRNA synthetase beta subunit
MQAQTKYSIKYYPDGVQSYKKEGNYIYFTTSETILEVKVKTDRIIRFRYAADGFFQTNKVFTGNITYKKAEKLITTVRKFNPTRAFTEWVTNLLNLISEVNILKTTVMMFMVFKKTRIHFIRTFHSIWAFTLKASMDMEFSSIIHSEPFSILVKNNMMF